MKVYLRKLIEDDQEFDDGIEIKDTRKNPRTDGFMCVRGCGYDYVSVGALEKKVLELMGLPTDDLDVEIKAHLYGNNPNHVLSCDEDVNYIMEVEKLPIVGTVNGMDFYVEEE